MNKKITLKQLNSMLNKDGKELYIGIDNCEVSIYLYNIKGDKVFRHLLRSDSSEISCGVMQVTNLPTNEDFRRIAPFIKGNKKVFYTSLFIYVLNKIKKDEYNRCAFIALSNNIHENTSIINDILNEICQTKSSVRANPNSGNKIKVWIY